MEKINKLLDALERERLYQRTVMDESKNNKMKWEFHKEMYFSLERIIEGINR